MHGSQTLVMMSGSQTLIKMPGFQTLVMMSGSQTLVRWSLDFRHLSWCLDLRHLSWCLDLRHLSWCLDLRHLSWCMDPQTLVMMYRSNTHVMTPGTAWISDCCHDVWISASSHDSWESLLSWLLGLNLLSRHLWLLSHVPEQCGGRYLCHPQIINSVRTPDLAEQHRDFSNPTLSFACQGHAPAASHLLFGCCELLFESHVLSGPHHTSLQGQGGRTVCFIFVSSKF